MIYARPNLWPWSYASMPDFSAAAGLAVGGVTSSALKLITQTTNVVLTVAWNVDYPQPAAPTISSVFSQSVRFNLPGAAPATAFQTSPGYYYMDTVGTLYPDSASRVLNTLSTAASAWPSLDTDFAGPQSLSGQMRVSRTGAGLVQTCMEIRAIDYNMATGAYLNTPASVVLSTIPMVMNVFSGSTPAFNIDFGLLYLTVNAVPPVLPAPIVNTFSASLTAYL